MIIDLTSVCTCEGREEEKEVHIDMESLRLRSGVFPIIKKQPFRLHLSNVENKRLLIQGETDVTIQVPCGRCLKEVPTALHLVIDKDLPLEGASSEEEEDDLEQSEYRNGYQLDVDRLAYHELLLIWPMKVLCKEDCKGICSKCGADLNVAECTCDRTVPDPRMAAFQDVFNKLKEV